VFATFGVRQRPGPQARIGVVESTGQPFSFDLAPISR